MNHTVGHRVRLKAYRSLSPLQLLTAYNVKQPCLFLRLWATTVCFLGQEPPLSPLSPPHLLSSGHIKCLLLPCSGLRPPSPPCTMSLVTAFRIREFAEKPRSPCQRKRHLQIFRDERTDLLSGCEKMYSVCLLVASGSPNQALFPEGLPPFRSSTLFWVNHTVGRLPSEAAEEMENAKVFLLRFTEGLNTLKCFPWCTMLLCLYTLSNRLPSWEYYGPLWYVSPDYLPGRGISAVLH